MPRGRPRSVPVSESEQSPITDAEAARRGLWAVYRLGPGEYTYIRGGQSLSTGEFVCWANDERAAKNAALQRSRDDAYPGSSSGRKRRRGRHDD